MAVTAKQARAALDRYLHCEERAEAAYRRAVNAGGSQTITGERNLVTEANWTRKAEAALAVVSAYLDAQSQAGH